MKLFKKISNVPVQYTLVLSVVLVILGIMTIQGDMSLAMFIFILSVGIFIVLQMYLGSIVIKTIISLIGIVYITSMYTNVVMSLHGNIVEPFLLSIGSITVFLAVTYNPNKQNYGIRSRPLWSFIVAILLISVKMTFILSGYSLLMTEVIGVNVLIVLIALWVLWLNTAKKTKIIAPNIEREVESDEFKFIYINDKLDPVNKEWIGNKYSKGNNAYPYIYNEAMKAHERGLSLVIVSNESTSKVYDVGELKVGKANKILYLYMQAKESHYKEDILKSFMKDLSEVK